MALLSVDSLEVMNWIFKCFFLKKKILCGIVWVMVDIKTDEMFYTFFDYIILRQPASFSSFCYLFV